MGNDLTFGVTSGLLAIPSCTGAFFLASQNHRGAALVCATLSLISIFASTTSLRRWNKNRSDELAKERLKKTLEKVRRSRRSDPRFPTNYF